MLPPAVRDRPACRSFDTTEAVVNGADRSASTVCSMAPNRLAPAASVISMRTRSPNLRNGVDGLPSRSVSTVRCSARHEAPFAVSSFAIVPEPTIVPATSGRVFAACATSSAKLNCMSTPASASPNQAPLIQVRIGRCSFSPCQASPSSSGVTSTGDSAERGLDCRKPKPFASSAGIRLRSETSLTRPTSWMWRRPPAAHRRPSARRR